MAKGLPEDQAELIVNTILETRDYDISKLLTKDQFALLEKDIDTIQRDIANMQKDISSMQQEITSIKVDIAEVKVEIQKSHNNLLKWLLLFFLSMLGFVAAVIFKN